MIRMLSKRSPVLRLFLLVLSVGVFVAGCSDNKVEPSAASNDAAMREEVLSAVNAAPSVVDDGLFATSAEATLAPTAPAQDQTSTTAIEPRAFWRQITEAHRTFEIAFADSDSTGQPTSAVVTVHWRLAGTFNIVPQTASGEWPDRGDVIRKPLRDHWVRRLLLHRVRVRDSERRFWKVVATSGVRVTSRDATTEIVSLRVEAGALDTTITNPLAFFRLRKILRFAPDETVRLTVTTTRSDDVLLLYHATHRRRMTNNGDNTYTGELAAGSVEGFRHFGVNALSHGTLFDDALPYDSRAWILPYAIDRTAEVDYLP